MSEDRWDVPLFASDAPLDIFVSTARCVGNVRKIKTWATYRSKFQKAERVLHSDRVF